jgi:hypothetical protein
MPWLSATASTSDSAWVGLPEASVVDTTTEDGNGGFGRSGFRAPTSSQPFGNVPTISSSKSSATPIGAAKDACGAASRAASAASLNPAYMVRPPVRDVHGTGPRGTVEQDPCQIVTFNIISELYESATICCRGL